MRILQGQGVSRGVALGKVHVFTLATPCFTAKNDVDKKTELQEFNSACEKAKAQLRALYEQTKERLGAEQADLFSVHEMLLEDPDFYDNVLDKIEEDGLCAAQAVQDAGAECAAFFAAMDDAYLKERAADISDVATRLLRILTNTEEEAALPCEPCILLAEDLTPSQTARLDQSKILGFATSKGSELSHTAIFARTLGIPAVVNVGAELLQIESGEELGLVGSEGRLIVQPNEEQRQELAALQEEQVLALEKALSFRHKKTQSKTGKSMLLCANVANLHDVQAAVDNDAEGIGLFRSEFLFLEQYAAPSEELQFQSYRKAVEKMQQRPCVIRTLDIGADKQVPYLKLDKEENPALGLRGIRLCLSQNDLFTEQLRALCRASVFGKLCVMLPMISSPQEVLQCRRILKEVQEQLLREGIPFDANMPLGIMIETPAAALRSEELAQVCDFFSIGTNDLTQYTLAVDRQNQALAPYIDKQYTAVLHLIEKSVRAAHAAEIWVGICGELAADKCFTQQFLEMGVDELSMAPKAILDMRAHISELE